MRVIVPHAIDLLSTNVTANSEPEWSPVTTYALGAMVKVTTSTPHTVYRSLRGNNTNRPPADWLVPRVEVGASATSNAVAIGSKTFTIQANLGFAVGMQVRIAKTTTPASVNMIGEVTSYTSATGVLVVIVASITGTGTYTGWTIESVDEIGFWAEVSATNQYVMLDGYVNTQTVMAAEIDIKLRTKRADYVTLFGLDGIHIELNLWDITETTLLWNKTISLAYGAVAVSAVVDWYEYFFGEYAFKADADVEFGAIAYDGVLGIKITAAEGADAKCGGVIVGRAFEIGTTTYGTTASIIDFSQRETDAIGRTSLRQGYWAKRNQIQVIVQNQYVDSVYNLLASLRGIPTAWMGGNRGEEYESMTIFGTCRNCSIVFSGPNRSGLDIEIEGLI